MLRLQKNFSGKRKGEGCFSRNKLEMGSVKHQKVPRTHPKQHGKAPQNTQLHSARTNAAKKKNTFYDTQTEKKQFDLSASTFSFQSKISLPNSRPILSGSLLSKNLWRRKRI
jgi:hypothetical protein